MVAKNKVWSAITVQIPCRDSKGIVTGSEVHAPAKRSRGETARVLRFWNIDMWLGISVTSAMSGLP